MASLDERCAAMNIQLALPVKRIGNYLEMLFSNVSSEEERRASFDIHFMRLFDIVLHDAKNNPVHKDDINFTILHSSALQYMRSMYYTGTK